MKTKVIHFCIGMLAGLILTGCIGVAGKLPPSYTYEQIPRVRPKPAISYDARFLLDGKEHVESTAGLERMVKMVFLLSEVFSKVEAAPESDGYHISVKMEAESNQSVERLSKVVSVLTLYLIPTYTHYPVTLTVDVKWGNDPIKQYVYQDHVNIWRHIFLIVVPRPTDRVVTELIEHMLLKFVHDVTEDQILMTSETPFGPLLPEKRTGLYQRSEAALQ